MKQTRSYQRFGAWALMLLFTAFWSLKTMHVMLAHHHDASEHPVCEASHDQKSAHIHDERWATDDCSLCAFVVSVPEPFSIPGLPIFSTKLPDSASPVFYHAPVFIQKACEVVMRRGPPSSLSV